MCYIQLGEYHRGGNNIDEEEDDKSNIIFSTYLKRSTFTKAFQIEKPSAYIQVKNKLRDLGKHGRFQIESVKDTSQDFKSTIQKSGRWERTVSKTSTFQLFP